jgi:hypothetical protein
LPDGLADSRSRHIFEDQSAPEKRSTEDGDERLEVDRFGKEFEGACGKAVLGDLQIGVTGEDYHGGLEAPVSSEAQDLHTSAAIHNEVTENSVESFAAEECEG